MRARGLCLKSKQRTLSSLDLSLSKSRFLSEATAEKTVTRPDESERTPLRIRSIPSGHGYFLYSLKEELSEVFTVYDNFFDAAKFTTKSTRLVIDTRYFSSTYRTSHRVLLAFTQLCRFARQKFLPWVWEHVESLYVRSPGLEQQECP